MLPAVSLLILSSSLVEKAATGSFSVKKVYLEISQNVQKNTCATVSFLIKLQAEVFSCEFCGIYKKTFLQNTSG